MSVLTKCAGQFGNGRKKMRRSNGSSGITVSKTSTRCTGNKMKGNPTSTSLQISQPKPLASNVLLPETSENSYYSHIINIVTTSVV